MAKKEELIEKTGVFQQKTPITNKFYLILLLPLLAIEIFALILFIIFYNINPDDSLFLFLIALIDGIIIIFILGRVLNNYEDNREDKFKELKPSKFLNLLNTTFNIMEKFPYEDKLQGKKRKFLALIGWISIGSIFFIGVFIRNFLEMTFFQTTHTLYAWMMAYSFYLFVFSTGCLSIYIITRININNILKIITFGFVLIIQIPYIVDIFILSPMRTIAYNFVSWVDFARFFSLFFLTPNISYAFGWGHIIMALMLMGLSSFFVFFRSYYDFDKKVKRNLKTSIIRTLLNALLIYISFTVAFSSFPYIMELINLIMANFPLPVMQFFSILLFGFGFNVYYFFFILLIVLKIRDDEKIYNLKLREIALENKINFSSSLHELEQNNKPYIGSKHIFLIFLTFFYEILVIYSIFLNFAI